MLLDLSYSRGECLNFRMLRSYDVTAYTGHKGEIRINVRIYDVAGVESNYDDKSILMLRNNLVELYGKGYPAIPFLDEILDKVLIAKLST